MARTKCLKKRPLFLNELHKLVRVNRIRANHAETAKTQRFGTNLMDLASLARHVSRDEGITEEEVKSGRR
jgi:hypothetical protein